MKILFVSLLLFISVLETKIHQGNNCDNPVPRLNRLERWVSRNVAVHTGHFLDVKDLETNLEHFEEKSTTMSDILIAKSESLEWHNTILLQAEFSK